MSSEQACPGLCNRKYRELREAFLQALDDYEREGRLDPNQSRPIPPDIQPWQGDPWCGTCKSKIRVALAQLDYLAGILAATADGHRAGPGGERVSGTAIHMSPSQAGDDLDELVSVLFSWEDSYREQMKWEESQPRRGHLAAPETECITWLMKHLDDILRHPDIGELFGTEILRWHREFTDKTKAGTRKLRKPLRCPSCQMLLLTWTEGDSHVECGNPDCRRPRIPLAEYEIEAERRAEALARGEMEDVA